MSWKIFASTVHAFTCECWIFILTSSYKYILSIYRFQKLQIDSSIDCKSFNLRGNNDYWQYIFFPKKYIKEKQILLIHISLFYIYWYTKILYRVYLSQKRANCGGPLHWHADKWPEIWLITRPWKALQVQDRQERSDQRLGWGCC